MTLLVALVPSRGRPDAAFELNQAFLDTCNTNIALRYVVDASDPLQGEYPPNTYECDTKGMVPALNHGALRALQDFPEALGFVFMGDDHRPRTFGWDEEYLNALAAMDYTGLVYGNDLLQGARIPTQGLLSTDIIRTLGWFAPPGFQHLYVDDAWLAIGNCINRVTYLPNVIVEHLHPMGNKAEWDEGYARVNAPEVASHDQQEFLRWKNQDLRDIKRKLEALL